jgi:hypothetical protein
MLAIIICERSERGFSEDGVLQDAKARSAMAQNRRAFMIKNGEWRMGNGEWRMENELIRHP